MRAARLAACSSSPQQAPTSQARTWRHTAPEPSRHISTAVAVHPSSALMVSSVARKALCSMSSAPAAACSASCTPAVRQAGRQAGKGWGLGEAAEWVHGWQAGEEKHCKQCPGACTPTAANQRASKRAMGSSFSSRHTFQASGHRIRQRHAGCIRCPPPAVAVKHAEQGGRVASQSLL